MKTSLKKSFFCFKWSSERQFVIAACLYLRWRLLNMIIVKVISWLCLSDLIDPSLLNISMLKVIVIIRIMRSVSKVVIMNSFHCACNYFGVQGELQFLKELRFSDNSECFWNKMTFLIFHNILGPLCIFTNFQKDLNPLSQNFS